MEKKGNFKAIPMPKYKFFEVEYEEPKQIEFQLFNLETMKRKENTKDKFGAETGTPRTNRFK